MTTPPCTNDAALFDSVDHFDHLLARATCATCPMVRACIERAVEVAGMHNTRSYRGPDGTWGGLLWNSGSVVQLAISTTLAEVA